MAVPVLLYGSETWTLIKTTVSQIKRSRSKIVRMFSNTSTQVRTPSSLYGQELDDIISTNVGFVPTTQEPC
jgi:hypothetical protein